MSKIAYTLWGHVNHFSFIVSAVFVLLLDALLGVRGNPVVALLMMPILILLVLMVWTTSHARQSPDVPARTDDFLDRLKQTGKYALLAFESEFCLTSTLVGRQLLDLEKAQPEKFQVYSLSVLKDPGKVLFEQFEGRITPTYVLLDDKGNVVMDWPLILPIERVIYAVEKQTASRRVSL